MDRDGFPAVGSEVLTGPTDTFSPKGYEQQNHRSLPHRKLTDKKLTLLLLLMQLSKFQLSVFVNKTVSYLCSRAQQASLKLATLFGSVWERLCRARWRWWVEGGGADRLAAAEMGGGEQRLLCMGRPLSVGRHRLTAAPQEHPRHTSAPLMCAHTCAHEFSVCCGCCVECVSVRMQSRGRRDVCARHDGTVLLPPPSPLL